MEAGPVVESDEPKKWERPWSVDEIRKNAADWSLAGDAGVSNIYKLNIDEIDWENWKKIATDMGYCPQKYDENISEYACHF